MCMCMYKIFSQSSLQFRPEQHSNVCFQQGEDFCLQARNIHLVIRLRCLSATAGW